MLAQPGASAVYFGGTVAYNTKRSRPLLLNDELLQAKLLQNRKRIVTADDYVASKIYWTRETSVAYCHALGVDYCIAEGGATGPTFHYGDMTSGFAVVSVAAAAAPAAGEPPDGSEAAKVVRHRVIHSAHANRTGNMALFAESAAEIALQVILEREEGCDPVGSVEAVTLEAPTTVSLPEERKSTVVSLAQSLPHLDRATHLRSQTDVLEQLAAAPQTRYVALRRTASLFRAPKEEKGHPAALLPHDDHQPRELAYLSRSELDSLCRSTGWTPLISFLGLLTDRNSINPDNQSSLGTSDPRQQPVFGVDLKGDNPSEESDATPAISDLLSQDLTWEDTRTSAPFLTPLHNEVLLYATALAEWQRRSSHCPACGGMTALDEMGHKRRCTACGNPFWPRQDPSMIAAVSSGDGSQLLLARSARHPPRVHTVLAGFVEAGETMEHAVAREVWEEVAVRIDPASVRYLASQPWPFPQSTMVGFLARAADCGNHVPPLRLQDNEIVEAGWFTRDQVRAAAAVPGPVMQHDYARDYLAQHPDTELLLPPKGVLARRLIDAWLDEGDS